MTRLLTIMLVLAALYPRGGTAQDSSVLATVDGAEIRADAFANRYIEYLLRTGTKDDARLRTATLEQIINERLITAEAHAAGLTSTDRFRYFRESARRKMLVESFLESQVRSATDVTEADLEEAFLRINTEVDARHLYARTKAEAERLHQRLQDGETFEALAREVFVDTVLANNGGAIGTFTFDDLDPDFEDAAFALAIGEVSLPVRTAQGYSIIQVTDRFTKPILTEMEFAQRKGKLEAFVSRKKRAQAQSHFVRGRAEDLNASFAEGFDRLLAQLTGTALMQDEELQAFLAEELVTFGPAGDRRTWTVADFRAQASFTDDAQRAQVRTEFDLEDFITGLIVREEMVSNAVARGLEETPEYRKALASALDEWVLDRRRAQIAAEIVVPEDSIRAHFDRHPDEFRGRSGEPLPYEQAGPLIAEQLRHTYIRDAAAAYVAGLRRAATIQTHRAALLALEIGGRSFPSPMESSQFEPAGSTERRTPPAPGPAHGPTSNKPAPADAK